MQSKDLSGNETVLRGEGRRSFDSLTLAQDDKSVHTPVIRNIWNLDSHYQLSIILLFHYKQSSTESIKKPPPFPAEVKKPVMGSIT